MICPSYDPITSHCAPSCCVCSQKDGCVTAMYSKLIPENKRACNAYISELLAEQKNAAQSATNTLNGRSRTTTNDSAFIVRGGERNCQA